MEEEQEGQGAGRPGGREAEGQQEPGEIRRTRSVGVSQQDRLEERQNKRL